MPRTLPAFIDNQTIFPYGQNLSSRGYQGEVRALYISVGHRRTKSGWEGGGPFHQRTIDRTVDGGMNLSLRFNGVKWDGAMRGVGSTNRLRPAASTWASSKEEMLPYSASGYNRTAPGGSGSLFTSVTELINDGLPAIPGLEVGKWAWKSIFRGRRPRVTFAAIPAMLYEGMKMFRSLGSEHLNIAFGWKPFVSDLQKTYGLMQTIDRQIAQIKRDNGRKIRRQTKMVDDTSTTQTTTLNINAVAGAQGAAPNFWGAAGVPCKSVGTKTVVVKKKIWYKATYQYFIPDTSSWQWNARARAVLFGALPSVGDVWDVVPWSWLIDWFSNYGDILHMHSDRRAVDNLVALWSWIMCQTSTMTIDTVHVYAAPHYNNSGLYLQSLPGIDHNFFTEEVVTSKSRVIGFPYAIGSTFDGLTTYQKGILAALGITRARFSTG